MLDCDMATHEWQVQEAKAELSALLKAAEDAGPQTITRHGEPVAVVLSCKDFDKLNRRSSARKGSLTAFFSQWPELEIPTRDQDDAGREISF
jgi:antitoxin Phd